MLYPRRLETLSTPLWNSWIWNWNSGQIRYTTPGSKVLIQMLLVPWLVKYPTCYGTQSFITLFTRACHLSLSCAMWTQPCPSIRFLRSIWIFTSKSRSSKWPHIFSFLYLTLYAYLLSHACHMPCPSHPPWFYHTNNIGEEYESWSFSLCNFL